MSSGIENELLSLPKVVKVVKQIPFLRVKVSGLTFKPERSTKKETFALDAVFDLGT